MSRFELRLTGSTSSCDGSSRPFDFFPVRDDMEEEEEDVTIPTNNNDS